MEHNYESFPFAFYWKIGDFSMLMPYRNKWLYSPLLRIPFLDRSWKIMLNPNFVPGGYISIYLLQTSNHQVRKERLTTDYSITLSVLSINHSNRKYISYSDSIDNLDCWGSKKFISWKLLLKEKEIWLPHDTLTIKCTIEHYVSNGDILNSFTKSMSQLYDKENKYLKSVKYESFKKSKSLDIERHAEGTEEINNNPSSKNLPKKGYKVPVLHSWFHQLYPEVFDSNPLCNLDGILENIILHNLMEWPDVGPRKWVSNLRLKKDRVSFTWFVKEYSRLTPQDKFFSPVFHCGSMPWKLMFFLAPKNTGDEVAEIFICPMTLYLKSKKVIKCKICVVNRNGRFPLSQEMVHLYENDGQWKFPTFIHNKMLEGDKHSYLPNDILILYCTFTVSDLNSESRQYWAAVEYSKEFRVHYIPLCGVLQLREDILHLFETGFNSDVALQVGQTEISAHQSILSERSSEFRCRIRYLKKTRKNEKLLIAVEDLDEETLRELLKYIYSGKHYLRFFYRHPLDSKAVKDKKLILAAHKYGVDVEILKTYGCLLDL